MKKLIYVFLIIFLASCGNEPNDLPEVPVRLIDGSSIDISELEGKTILVLYQPGCDHCQDAAVAMEQNRTAFDDYQVYFISSSPIAENQQFALQYKLINARNFHFGTTLVDYILEKFGSIPTPSFYIYSDEGMLEKEFIGETDINQVLDQISS
jgi:peroxiredoxin